MLLRNETPFAAIGFGDLHRDGMTMACIAARASYLIGADGVLTLANDQEIVMNDVYEGDPHRTPLVQVADLIAYKPAADVTVLGRAYAPGGVPAASWVVGITIGTHEVRLRVHGTRYWEPSLNFLTPTWKLGIAAPVESVPLDYRLAAGGRWVGDWDGRADERNHIGPGVLRRDASPVGRPLPAPQIEAVDEPIVDPFAITVPRGFGPIPPFSAFRELYCGTRDEEWQRERMPRMPSDFSYHFFQTAHPDLVVPKLHGSEVIKLVGLTAQKEPLVFVLPEQRLMVHHHWFDGRQVESRLLIDGLHFDLRRPEGPWLLDLTWRGWIVQCPFYHGAILSQTSHPAASGMIVSNEFGLSDEEISS